MFQVLHSGFVITFLEIHFCPNFTCLHKSLKVPLENSVEKKYHQKWPVFKSYYNIMNKIIQIFVHEVLNSCGMLRGTGTSFTQTS